MSRKALAEAKRRLLALWVSQSQLLKAVGVGIVALAVMVAAVDHGEMKSIEHFMWDIELAIRSGASDSTVALVRIDDVDRSTLFGNRAPLDPDRIAEVVEAIATARPKVIGVLLDTADPVYGSLAARHFGAPTIWGQGAVYSHTRTAFVVSPVLGGTNTAGQFKSGVVTISPDEDSVVRRYRRTFQTPEGPVSGLTWLLVAASGSALGATEVDETERLIEAYGCPDGVCRVQLPARQVLALQKSEGWRKRGPLRDKVVLLGASYGAQDEQETPFGWMTGLELTAWVLETELNGGGPLPIGWGARYMLALFGGAVVVVIFRRSNPKRAIGWGAVSVPIIAASCSLMTVHSLAYVPYFLPTTTAMLGHAVYRRMKDRRAELLLRSYAELRGGSSVDPTRQHGDSRNGDGPSE